MKLTKVQKHQGWSLTKHYDGCYRVRRYGPYFGQIKKQDRMWVAEVRDIETGNFIRPAGIWKKGQDALDELLSLI